MLILSTIHYKAEVRIFNCCIYLVLEFVYKHTKCLLLGYKTNTN